MISGYVHSCSQCHVVFSFTFYVASSQASCTSHIYCKLEVYVCLYMCSSVQFCVLYSRFHLCEDVLCMCMYVCALSEVILLLKSAVMCCCSLPAAIETLQQLNGCCCPVTSFPALFFLSNSEVGLYPPHTTPLPPTGCWQFCSSLVEKKINSSRWTFKWETPSFFLQSE